MGFFELVLIAVGLSMDAFAVSVCKGLSVGRVTRKHALTAGLYFGCFQALMPLIGYALGMNFESLINKYDHWVAFGLLALIGANMIKESFGKDEKQNDSFAFSVMFLLAVATSIDALAVGIVFVGAQGINIYSSVALIGAITFAFSYAGIYIGSHFGAKYKSKAEFAGGCILVLIGLKILLEGLAILG